MHAAFNLATSIDVQPFLSLSNQLCYWPRNPNACTLCTEATILNQMQNVQPAQGPAFDMHMQMFVILIILLHYICQLAVYSRTSHIRAARDQGVPACKYEIACNYEFKVDHIIPFLQ